MARLHAEQLIAECLEEFRCKRDAGEPTSPGEWRDRLGERYGEFLDALEVDAMLSEIVEPAPIRELLPRHFGEYLLLEKVGGGAMGIVYEAVHQGLSRRVALKVLRPGLEGEPEALERFLREARACAKVRHPNVVTIHDAGTTGGRPWYSMDLLPGRSLRDLVVEDRVPPLPMLCAGLAEVADALDTLHQAGIVHRDVKPGNIVLDDHGRMVLADFGLARCGLYCTLTQSGQALGTPLYMSPEQVPGAPGPVDARTDVYGLGATLYEAVAGRPPFKGGSFESILAQVAGTRPAPLTDHDPAAPEAVNRIALKALEKRKEDRYQTAAAMRDDLRAFAAGRAVTGRPVSPLCRTLRRCRMALAAAAVLLLLAGGVLGWVLTRPAVLLVSCRPEVEIRLDGRPMGSVGRRPVSIEVAPGAHTLAVARPGFSAESETIEVGPRERRSVVFVLRVADPEDPEALSAIGAEAGVRVVGRSDPGRPRGASAVGPLFPRGAVRVGDLDSFQVEFADPYDVPEGEIRFLRGTEVLAVIAPAVAGPFPEAVVRALRAGDRIRWGFWPLDGEPGTAEFEVVEDPLRDFEARVEEWAAVQPAELLSHLRCEELLKHRLFIAAHEEASRIHATRPGSARAWLVRIEALDGLGLWASRLRAEAVQTFDALPDAERRRGKGAGSPE